MANIFIIFGSIFGDRLRTRTHATFQTCDLKMAESTSLSYSRTFVDVLGTSDLLLWVTTSVTRLGDLFDFGQLFKAFGGN